MNQGKDIVVVTGITGYLGSAILRLLFKMQEEQNKNWIIRGVVRNLKNKQKLKHLQDYFGSKMEDPTRFQLAEADMANYQQMVDAFAGARYVIHTAVSVIFIEKVEWEYYEKNVL